MNMIVARTDNTSYSILSSHNGCDAENFHRIEICTCTHFFKCTYTVYCGTIEPVAAVVVPEAMLDVWVASLHWLGALVRLI